ncbi:MAG: hypothetical protein J0L99_05585 [Chitinophagales bacterium]|nr:hypothetical protein [Chitinophagales bacterium]
MAAAQTINQKKAVELLRGGQSVSDYTIYFNDDKVEALDAFLLRKNGIDLPDSLVFYDDASINFEDDADLAAGDFEEDKLVRILRAEVVIDNEIADWVTQSNINVNQLLSNLMRDFYKNVKATPLLNPDSKVHNTY